MKGVGHARKRVLNTVYFLKGEYYADNQPTRP